MKHRFVQQSIEEAMADTPVIYLQGARQSGKTTLVRSLEMDGSKIAYRTLDDVTVLEAASSDPEGFVDGLPERVILDEVQRVPELFRAIKRNVDRDRRPGRFLLTGSANAMLLPKISESLAGRVEVITLDPFSQGEIEESKEGFINACFKKRFPKVDEKGESWAVLLARIVRGGFPEVVKRDSEARRAAWLGGYITTVLERDARDISDIRRVSDLARAFRLLAARSSATLNLSSVSRDAAIPVTTLQRYWALLEALFLVRTLPAWSGNLTSRLAKAPKMYISDSALLCHLLGLGEARLGKDELMAGAVLETFVVQELARQSRWCSLNPALFHFRTQKQQEVDVVMEDASGSLVGIEIKKTSSPGKSDFKGLRHFQEQVGGKFHRGILLYTGEVPVSFGNDLYALPVSYLWGPK